MIIREKIDEDVDAFSGKEGKRSKKVYNSQRYIRVLAYE